MESNVPDSSENRVHESFIGSRGGDAFKRVTQMHAFRALARISRINSVVVPRAVSI